MTDNAPLRRQREAEMELDLAVIEEVNQLDIAGRIYQFRPETRCRICRNPEINDLVNKLLSHGLSYPDILVAIKPLSGNLSIKQRPTINTLRNHTVKHYGADVAGRKVYRDILEARAIEAGKDFVQGMGTAITPLAYLESVMVKGYESAMAPDAKVSASLGMQAAVQLHTLTSVDDTQADANEMMVQMNAVIEAVKAVVPTEYWEQIVERLNGFIEVEPAPQPISGFDPGDLEDDE